MHDTPRPPYPMTHAAKNLAQLVINDCRGYRYRLNIARGHAAAAHHSLGLWAELVWREDRRQRERYGDDQTSVPDMLAAAAYLAAYHEWLAADIDAREARARLSPKLGTRAGGLRAGGPTTATEV